MKEKNYIVYSPKFANKLIKMGFTMVESKVNYNNPKYYVYYFKPEEGLVDAIERMKAQQ